MENAILLRNSSRSAARLQYITGKYFSNKLSTIRGFGRAAQACPLQGRPGQEPLLICPSLIPESRPSVNFHEFNIDDEHPLLGNINTCVYESAIPLRQSSSDEIPLVGRVLECPQNSMLVNYRIAASNKIIVAQCTLAAKPALQRTHLQASNCRPAAIPQHSSTTESTTYDLVFSCSRILVTAAVHSSGSYQRFRSARKSPGSNASIPLVYIISSEPYYHLANLAQDCSVLPHAP
jgi:hypothetical protein